MILSVAPARARPRDPPLPPPRPAELARPAETRPEPPLPPPRPPELANPAAEASPAPVAPPSPNLGDSSCATALASGHLVGSLVPAIIGPGQCGIPEPLRLDAIVLENGVQIAVDPPTAMRCQLASALAEWVRDDLAGIADKLGSPLVKILGGEAYQCRGRNGVPGAQLSEHGKGNALDIRGFALKDGRQFLVDKKADRDGFMSKAKDSACARFWTVLGPGSDGYHETHMHVDLRERRNNYRICQYEMH